jgi:hypothetical protein
LLQHHPIFEYKSQLANDYIRGNAEGWERNMRAGPPGERYYRLKAKAEIAMHELLPAMMNEIQPAA